MVAGRPGDARPRVPRQGLRRRVDVPRVARLTLRTGARRVAEVGDQQSHQRAARRPGWRSRSARRARTSRGRSGRARRASARRARPRTRVRAAPGARPRRSGSPAPRRAPARAPRATSEAARGNAGRVTPPRQLQTDARPVGAAATTAGSPPAARPRRPRRAPADRSAARRDRARPAGRRRRETRRRSRASPSSGRLRRSSAVTSGASAATALAPPSLVARRVGGAARGRQPQRPDRPALDVEPATRPARLEPQAGAAAARALLDPGTAADAAELLVGHDQQLQRSDPGAARRRRGRRRTRARPSPGSPSCRRRRGRSAGRRRAAPASSAAVPAGQTVSAWPRISTRGRRRSPPADRRRQAALGRGVTTNPDAASSSPSSSQTRSIPRGVVRAAVDRRQRARSRRPSPRSRRAAAPRARARLPSRPPMTFTILGRCPRTGQLGGAVTTSDIAVGARVLFARRRARHRRHPAPHRPAAGPGAARAVGARRVAASRRSRRSRPATRHRDWRQLGALDRARADAAPTRASAAVAARRRS